MFAKIFCVILGIFLLSGNVYAQEESVSLKQSSEVVNSYCGVSTALAKARKESQRIFAGIIDKYNILYLTLDKDGFWTISVANMSGVSCIYFMGQTGTPMIDTDKKKDTDFKGNIGRRINGKYIYK